MISQQMQDELDWQAFIEGMNIVLDLAFEQENWLSAHPLSSRDEAELKKLVLITGEYAQQQKFNRVMAVKLKGIQTAITSAVNLALDLESRGIKP